MCSMPVRVTHYYETSKPIVLVAFSAFLYYNCYDACELAIVEITCPSKDKSCYLFESWAWYPFKFDG